MNLQKHFGAIDVYLFDQLLRGRIERGMRILDAGCGGGRNLVYLLQEGHDVWAADGDAAAVDAVRALAPEAPDDRFYVGELAALPFEQGSFDFVISCAVLHFARDHGHFDEMVDELGRVLAPGGILFARLASDIGIEDRVEPVGRGRYALPDGSERYLVNEARLHDLTARLGGELLDPIKTTNVEGRRCMTTWVVRKA